MEFALFQVQNDDGVLRYMCFELLNPGVFRISSGHVASPPVVWIASPRLCADPQFGLTYVNDFDRCRPVESSGPTNLVVQLRSRDRHKWRLILAFSLS